jgi:maltose O-acetyltransferase
MTMRTASRVAAARRRVADRLRLALACWRAHILLADCELGSFVSATGLVRAEARGGRIAIGDRVTFVGGLAPTQLLASVGSSISIGAYTVVNYGTRFESMGAEIVVGRRCLLASGVRVTASSGASVRVGDEVWIAHGAVLEPGVRVGARSVIAAAAVVTCDVPAGSLAIGNPARVLSLELTGAKRARVLLPV